ncbi:MAG: flippase [Pacificimonas sp.]
MARFSFGDRLQGRLLSYFSVDAREIGGNTAWLLFDRLVRMSLGFLVGAWVARALGPDDFGTLSYALSFILMFQAIATFGADTVVVQKLAVDEDNARETLGSAFLLRCALGLFCWIAAPLIMLAMNPGEPGLAILTAIIGGSLLFQAADCVDLWFQSKTQSRRTVMAKLTAYVLTNGVKVALILLKAPLVYFALAVLAEAIAVAIALSIAYRLYPTRGAWKASRHMMVEIIRSAWPFMLSGLLIMIYMRIDMIMLKELKNDTEVGLYAAALPLSQLLQIVPLTVVTSMAPLVARKRQENIEAYEKLLLFMFRMLVCASLVLAIVTAALAPWLVQLLFGADYAVTAEVLRIHVFSGIFISMGLVQGLWFVNEGKGWIYTVKTFMGALVVIIGNFYVIPLSGAQGAAGVAVGAHMLSAWLSNLILAPKIWLMQIGIAPR